MSCYNPMKAFVLGKNPANGKNVIKVVSRDYDGKEFTNAGYEQIGIPCGKCIGCRLDYSRTWADRMIAESMYHKDNIFLTLTYDDKHLPKCNKGSKIHPLVKRDLQLFMKKLRKELSPAKVRFFASGEYGSTTFRPHYHLILFNCKLDDLKLLKYNELNQAYYISETIDKLWNKGFHIITQVTWDTCAYVARYVVKKQKGIGADVYEKLNFTPEFSTMSRKPGIGFNFYDDRGEELYAYGNISIPTKDGAHIIRPCRYYDNLFDIEYPDVMEDIKEKRKDNAISYNKLRSSLTGLNYNDMLKSAEAVKNDTVKSLKRKEI